MFVRLVNLQSITIFFLWRQHFQEIWSFFISMSLSILFLEKLKNGLSTIVVWMFNYPVDSQAHNEDHGGIILRWTHNTLESRPTKSEATTIALKALWLEAVCVFCRVAWMVLMKVVSNEAARRVTIRKSIECLLLDKSDKSWRGRKKEATTIRSLSTFP